MQVVLLPRTLAKERGLLWYCTNKLCSKGHLSYRRIQDSQCHTCYVIKFQNSNKTRDKEKHRQRNLRYYYENKDAVIKYISKWQAVQRKTNPIFAMKRRLSSALRKHNIQKNGYSEILGCNLVEFRTHLEKQFVSGMGWHNQSSWHIDHIIPCSSAKNENELRSLFHFTNLRPIWAKDNLVKSDKIQFLI